MGVGVGAEEAGLGLIGLVERGSWGGWKAMSWDRDGRWKVVHLVVEKMRIHPRPLPLLHPRPADGVSDDALGDDALK